jgi:sugar lactone lactonase YvrE
VDSAGNNYVADTGNGTIRTVTPAGVVSTLAGSAGNFGSTDATGSNARFCGPQDVAVDRSGNLYVADTANHTIRKITAGGVVSTLAGVAGTNGLTDGTGSNARFNAPQGLAVDSSGTVYVADTWNHTIRKMTSVGVVSTLAGVAGYYGDIDGNGNGDGTNTARFYCPSGVAVDASGSVYVADTRNHTIRKVTASGVVSTLAGKAGVWGSADGTNSDARFYEPQGITVDFSGNLYVLDSGNQTIRMVAPVGTNWVVTTVAGLPGVSGSADGTGPNARFFRPGGIGMNSAGSLCVADWGNNTIRAGVSSLYTSPTILLQPQAQSANLGQSATFSVTAAGLPPLTCQWLFYGTNLEGATAFTYTCLNAQPANAGPYSVIVSNTLGTATSSNAWLTIILPPTITSPPQSLTIDQGTDASFSVAASGTAPFTYQWLFNGAMIASATASGCTRTNAQLADAGSYSVIVSNSAGSATSAPGILTVHPVPTPPGITAQPQNQTVSQSSNATFTVAATGSTPFSYQWRFYGTNLAGATASSFTCANAQAPNAGPYSVIVTNDYGMITSSVATLTVILPPVINVQPANQLAAVSNTVAFTVGLAQGTSPAYQWRRNGTPISGATQPSLTLSPLTWGSAGTYSVVVSNSAGNQTSADATLIIQQAAFTFFDGFESYQTGSLDQNTSGGPNTSAANPWWALSTSRAQGWVTNAGSGVTPHGGSQMVGTTSSVRQDYLNLIYRLNAGQLYYGNFLCEWWFYDPYGTTASGATNSQDYLSLCQYAPVSTTSDTSTFTTYNQRMSLGTFNSAGYNYSNYQARIVGATGGFNANGWFNTATLRSVGWHHARIVIGIPDAANSAPVWMYLDNMTNATFSYPSAGGSFGFNLIEMNHAMSKAGYAGYYDDFAFRAANDPWIIEQPVGQAVSIGQPASFTTVAVGTAYQWQFNGANINGATTSAYSIVAVAATNAGSYACVITGTNGPITTSPVATLTVLVPATFDSLSLLADGSLQLSMSGTAYANYVLEATSDWVSWAPLTTLSGTNGFFQFNDPSAATNSERFYRLRLGP